MAHEKRNGGTEFNALSGKTRFSDVIIKWLNSILTADRIRNTK